MHILHTFLYIFLLMLRRRICLTIWSFLNWWSFPVLSWPLHLIQGWYWTEKLNVWDGWISIAQEFFKLEHAFLILALVLTLPHLSKLPMGQGVQEVLTSGSPDKSEDFPTCSSSRLLWFLFDELKCCLPLKKNK